jgi:predicted DNA-binding transcriptional regulator
MGFINSTARVHSAQPDQDITLGLEDLLLRELQENMNPLSLKELQVKISLMRPVTAITVAASLDRLCRKGRVARKIVGEGRAHYAYSARSTEQHAFSQRAYR